MNWLRQAVTPKGVNWVSSKRVVLMWAAFILGVATIILAVAACYGIEVGVAITATSGTLAGLGGFTYTMDKANERSNRDVESSEQ